MEATKDEIGVFAGLWSETLQHADHDILEADHYKYLEEQGLAVTISSFDEETIINAFKEKKLILFHMKPTAGEAHMIAEIALGVWGDRSKAIKEELDKEFKMFTLWDEFRFPAKKPQKLCSSLQEVVEVKKQPKEYQKLNKSRRFLTNRN